MTTNRRIGLRSRLADILAGLTAGLAAVPRWSWGALTRRQLAAERQRLALAQRVEHLMKQANDAIFLCDARANRFLEANDRALAMYGYSLAELQTFSPVQLRAPEMQEKFSLQAEELNQRGRLVYETLHQRKDGAIFPVEVSANVVEIDGASYWLAFIRDISSRKSREKEIARLSQLYATLSALNRNLARAHSREELLQTACTVAARHAGFKLAWIGQVDSQTQQVRPVACAGDSLEYLNQVRIYVNEPPELQCPAGRCLREQRACICNEFASDVLAAGPWQQAAQACGLQAAAALPLALDGEVRGAFVVYAGEPGVFQDKEVALLEEMALDIAHALQIFEQESKRRQAEQALQARQEELLSIYDHAPIVMCLLDEHLRTVRLNRAACEFAGRPESELLDLRGGELLGCGNALNDAGGCGCGAQCGQCALHAALANTLATGKSHLGIETYPRLKRQGHLQGCSVLASTARLTIEGKTRILLCAEDISARRRAEAALRESERRFRDMMENVQLVAVILDEQGRSLFCNEYLLQLTGWQSEEVLGRDYFEVFIPAEQRQQIGQVARSVFQGNAVPHYENEIITRTGERRLIAWSNTRLQDVAGRVVGLASIGEDITGRKQLELQLRQAQKMEAIGQLAGGVAHDFNNILAATMLSLELLMMDASLSAQTQQSLKELMAHAERAAGLTRQLLLFGRRTVMQVRALDVNEVVEQLLKMLRRLIGEHIHLEWHAKSQLPVVMADAGMLEQVVMNLVVNARDAMVKGGQLTLASDLMDLGPEQVRHLEANPPARPGRFVCLAVTDTGCGMDETLLKRIFEPFFTTKEAGKGTGLGLATVYGIVGQHQGWITVESRGGKGSTFRVFLPVADKPAAESAAAPPAAPARGGSETILLVEDDPGVRKTTRSFLHRWGYQVLEAENGVEALSLWQSHQQEVDLLLTDMVMPAGLSGLELAERLRATKPNLKIVISSGYSNELVHHGAAALEGIQYCPKPCPPAELAATLRRCLDPSAGGRTA